jgi:5-methylcytosine-specific restriction endonuclease McrA
MKNHTKVYLNFFGYTIEDFIPCESCGAKAVDIHHIEARGMGGSKKSDVIENLMALCRQCHVVMGDTKTHMEYLKEKHNDKIKGKSNF